jgi:glycine betaine/choline ABC-type transport system substrate-binding protein
LRVWSLLLAILLTLAVGGCGPARSERIVVGGKNFTEQNILAEFVAQQIEARIGVPVARKLNLGGTLICHEALRAGQIDLYVEYSGTALTAILGEEPQSDPASVYRLVRDAYADRFDLLWGDPLGFNNTFAIIVRGEDARRLGLRTISDVALHAPGWRPGFGYEFMERPDGYRGLIETYGLTFGEVPRTMELGLIYRALKEDQVDLVAGNSTDGVIEALDLTVLVDDRGYFPPYEAGWVVRRETLRRHTGLEAALREMNGRIPESLMRRMNHAVDGRGRGLAEVALEMRREAGLAGD